MQNKTIILILSAACLLAVISAFGTWDKDNNNYALRGEDWYLLNAADTYLCDDKNVNLRGGKQQSPIDIKTETTIFTYDESLKTSFNNIKGATIYFHGNHSIKVVDSGLGSTQFQHSKNTLTKYDPIQFHFHSPSEHKIDGELQDLEMHIVHTIDTTVSSEFSNLNGAYLVIGLIFSAKKNVENQFIKGLGLTKGTLNNEVKDVEFKLKDLMDSIPNKYYTYKGSFTTPPCTEGVNWNVMSTVIDISKDQLTQFTQYFNITTPTRLRQAAETSGASAWCGGVGNNRIVQPVNSRSILFHDNTDYTVEQDESYMSTLAIVLVVILSILVVILIVVVIMKSSAGGSAGGQKINQENNEVNKLNTSVDVKQ